MESTWIPRVCQRKGYMAISTHRLAMGKTGITKPLSPARYSGPET